jgi:hypothetical protein
MQVSRTDYLFMLSIDEERAEGGIMAKRNEGILFSAGHLIIA